MKQLVQVAQVLNPKRPVVAVREIECFYLKGKCARTQDTACGTAGEEMEDQEDDDAHTD